MPGFIFSITSNTLFSTVRGSLLLEMAMLNTPLHPSGLEADLRRIGVAVLLTQLVE